MMYIKASILLMCIGLTTAINATACEDIKIDGNILTGILNENLEKFPFPYIEAKATIQADQQCHIHLSLDFGVALATACTDVSASGNILQLKKFTVTGDGLLQDKSFDVTPKPYNAANEIRKQCGSDGYKICQQKIGQDNSGLYYDLKLCR